MRPSPVRTAQLGYAVPMERKINVTEKETVKDKLLGGVERKHETEMVSQGILSSNRKIEKKVTKKKI
jgi:hypothetical protein